MGLFKKKTVYSTNEWNSGRGSSKSYTHNEYYDEGDKVTKYKVTRSKVFDGKENEWRTNETFQDSWDKNDSSMPDWLKNKVK